MDRIAVARSAASSVVYQLTELLHESEDTFDYDLLQAIGLVACIARARQMYEILGMVHDEVHTQGACGFTGNAAKEAGLVHDQSGRESDRRSADSD